MTSRRSILSAIGLGIPFGVGSRLQASRSPPVASLRFRPFEEAVRSAFADESLKDQTTVQGFPRRRIEVGPCDRVQAGVQGCHNDRPFAGFPAGSLRIVRTGAEPGPVVYGLRLFVATVDVVLTSGPTDDAPSRPLDFASLPPAPTFA